MLQAWTPVAVASLLQVGLDCLWRTKAGGQRWETYGLVPWGLPAPELALGQGTERMLQARAPGVSQGQVGRFHLVLGLPRVQQLKLAPEELVVSVQWVWHLFHFLLLTRGCLQGLGQLDVR